MIARCFVATYGSDTYEATTKNISRTGLFLQLALNGAEQETPRVGEAVIIDVELPTNRRFGPKCLRCRGTVVRAGACGEIAVQALQMEFRDQTRGFTTAGDSADPHVGASKRVQI